MLPTSQKAREMGHPLLPPTYRRACPVEFNQSGYTAKHTPNAPRVSLDRIVHLSKPSTGTKVTNKIAISLNVYEGIEINVLFLYYISNEP
jgi:hypothetical protein